VSPLRICALMALLAPLPTANLHAQTCPDETSTPSAKPVDTDENKASSGKIKIDGMFGPLSSHPKAGDPAPDITFTKVLHAPLSTPWTNANLSGQITVLTFFPYTSYNSQSISQWNALIAQFADRPVQFVWIASEREYTLLPFLKKHPIDGWVFNDPCGKTGARYGLELPQAVFIGADGKIIGFDQSPLPTDQALYAALENRTRTTPVKLDSADRKAILESNQVLLDTEPQPVPHIEDFKPRFPSSYEVHISPAAHDSKSTSGGYGFDSWSVHGAELKNLIATIYSVDPGRVDFPNADAAKKQYDIDLFLPEQESPEAMAHRIQEALKQQLHLSITPETHSMDVYVLTAPNGPGPALHDASSSSGGSIGSSNTEMEWKSPDGREPTPEDIQHLMEQATAAGISVSGISISNGTIDVLRWELEKGLDRPVIDETNLTGSYDLEIAAGDRTREQFFQLLRDRFGLVVTPSQRNIMLVTVRQSSSAAMTSATIDPTGH
jgi:uncharacterized protein (TIGR03435 family)